MHRKTLGSSFPFVLVLAGVLSAFNAATDLDQLVGKWDIEFEIDGNPGQAVLELRHSDEGLSGTWTDPGYPTVDLERVAADGKTVSFVRTAGVEGQTFEIHYSAAVEHDEMKGTMKTLLGENSFTGKKR